MLTNAFMRENGWLTTVNGEPVPEHLAKLRIPPAWLDVVVDPDPQAIVLATGTDAAGRKQRIYSPTHTANAKSDKFERVKALSLEWEDIRTQIESDINEGKGDAALVAHLIYCTGIRPGSNADTLAKVQAYGATTVQMRHIHPSPKGIRLKFIGKKGVAQSILVTDPHLVQVTMERKDKYGPKVPIFDVSASSLRDYFKTLGSGDYTPKDFRTMRGTSLAMELIGNRQRFPKSQTKRKKLLNAVLDKVARQLGNTRAVSRSSYVDPAIVERFMTS